MGLAASCAANCVGARARLERFLREAEDAGRVMEAGVARRGLGLTCYFAGDFVEARSPLRTGARRVSIPSATRRLAERFGDDTGDCRDRPILALTTWHLGEVDRARELIEQANRRATELGHVATHAH